MYLTVFYIVRYILVSFDESIIHTNERSEILKRQIKTLILYRIRGV